MEDDLQEILDMVQVLRENLDYYWLPTEAKEVLDTQLDDLYEKVSNLLDKIKENNE